MAVDRRKHVILSRQDICGTQNSSNVSIYYVQLMVITQTTELGNVAFEKETDVERKYTALKIYTISSIRKQLQIKRLQSTLRLE